MMDTDDNNSLVWSVTYLILNNTIQIKQYIWQCLFLQQMILRNPFN